MGNICYICDKADTGRESDVFLTEDILKNMYRRQSEKHYEDTIDFLLDSIALSYGKQIAGIC